MSIYALKPRFQALLRPLVKLLHGMGATANQVTLAAAAMSLGLGVALCFTGDSRWFLLMPLLLFVRMAMNAVDGMLAREFGQQSHLGAYLNELCDLVSDAALYLPFAFVAPFSLAWIAGFTLLAWLGEYAGVLGSALGATRRYDGPLGKSDRAFAFGALGLWLGLAGRLPAVAFWLMPLFCVLAVFTLIRRVRSGLREIALSKGQD